MTPKYKYRKISIPPPPRCCILSCWHLQLVPEWCNLLSCLLPYFPSASDQWLPFTFLVGLLLFVVESHLGLRSVTEHPYHKGAKESQTCSKPGFLFAWSHCAAMLSQAPGSWPLSGVRNRKLYALLSLSSLLSKAHHSLSRFGLERENSEHFILFPLASLRVRKRVDFSFPSILYLYQQAAKLLAEQEYLFYPFNS